MTFAKTFALLALCALIATVTNNDVVEISSSDELDKLIEKSTIFNNVVVLFHNQSDPESKPVVESFIKIASDFQSLSYISYFASFVSVDISQSEDILESQGLKAKNLPAIKLFSGIRYSDNHLLRAVTYENVKNPVNVATDIVKMMFEVVKRLSFYALGLEYTNPQAEKEPGAGTVILTQSSFVQKLLNQSVNDGMALIEFFVVWCGHCEQFDQVAKQIHDDKKTYGESTLIAAIDVTMAQSLVQTYDIKRLPTILLFVGGKLEEEYEGPRDAESLIAFLKENLPPIESTFTQLTSFDDYEETCLSAPICVMAFVPSLYDCDAKCRKGYIKILHRQAIGDEMVASGRGWSFFWLEGGSSRELRKLEGDLGVGPGVGYPNLVVIDGKKGKFAPFRGCFSKNGLNRFFNEIIYGGKWASPLYPLVESRKLLARVKAAKTKLDPEWDGKDATLIHDKV